MDDLISRQEAIDVLNKIFPADPMRNDYTQGITCGAALATEYIKQLPSAQPETHEERTETHACDLIDRQAAIDALDEIRHALWEIDRPSPTAPEYVELHEQVQSVWKLLDKKQKELYVLPSAQPVAKDTNVPINVNDCISRQYAIRIVDGIDTWQAGWRGDAIESIKALPSAQPEKRTEERTETHSCDLIDRQAAIDKLETVGYDFSNSGLSEIELEEVCEAVGDVRQDMISMIKRLPSAQPEIIRCGQCKYAEVADKEDAQDGYTCQFHRGSVWFSGSYCSWAERRADG